MSLEDAAVERAPKPVPNTPESVFAQLRMDGKVVAITGGADGIGFAVAEAVAEAGANVALWYNSNSVAIERSKELEAKFGIKSKAYQVEVSDHKAVEQTMSQVVADFGKLDVFVANAGMAISKAITEQTVEEYRKQMSVNGQYQIPLCGKTSQLTTHSRWSLLLRQICRCNFQEPGIRQSYHHIEYFCTHSQRSRGPAGKISSDNYIESH